MVGRVLVGHRLIHRLDQRIEIGMKMVRRHQILQVQPEPFNTFGVPVGHRVEKGIVLGQPEDQDPVFERNQHRAERHRRQ